MKTRNWVWMAGLMCTALAGCTGGGLSPQGQSQLKSALGSYQSDDNAATVRHADAVLAETTRGPGAMQAYYLRGMAKYRQKNYDAARADLQVVVARSDDDALLGRALDGLGEIAYRLGQDLQAVDYFRRALQKIDETKAPADHSHYRLGCALQRVGRWTEADLHFQRVMYYFPQGELARRSRHRANARAWTIQAGSFSQRDKAHQAMAAWKAKPWPVRVEPALGERQMTFLLEVGRWTQHEQAIKELPAIRQVQSDAFLTVTR
jgi:tetratricopeptide (TPR) repeat protein